MNASPKFVALPIPEHKKEDPIRSNPFHDDIPNDYSHFLYEQQRDRRVTERPDMGRARTGEETTDEQERSDLMQRIKARGNRFLDKTGQDSNRPRRKSRIRHIVSNEKLEERESINEDLEETSEQLQDLKEIEYKNSSQPLLPSSEDKI